MSDLSAAELDRYARQIVLEAIGPEGQAAIGEARVLVVGAGGLGSPVCQYLAAGGVGHLTIVDDDTVERSNLHRQVLHGVDDIGRPKVASARDAIEALNPAVEVDARETRVDPDTAAALVEAHDVVVDAADDLTTTFLLSDAATLAGRPLVHAAVVRMEGQLTVFPGDGPCYRCLHREAPPAGSVPDCATAGVLGVVPGVVGTLQATEVCKLLAGAGDPLAGRLLIYDGATASVEEVDLRAAPDCPVCGPDPTVRSLSEVDYGDRCRPSESR